MGSFSRAADFLGVKQSSLSKNVQKLEKELGEKLFIRGPRKLFLTEKGHLYREALLESQKTWEQAQESVLALNTELRGSFHFGCHNVLAHHFLSPFLKKISKESGIHLKLHFLSSREATEAVKDLSLDFCVAASPLDYPELVMRPLWKEFVGLYSKDARKKGKLLLHSNMIGAQRYVKNIQDADIHYVQDYFLIRKILKENSEFMGILPSPVAERSGLLKCIQKLQPSVNVQLAYRADRSKTPGFRFCLSALKSSVSQKR